MKFDHTPLADVLKDLGSKAGVSFTYAERLLDPADRVTCEAADVEAGRLAMRLLLPRDLKLGNTDETAVSVVKRDASDEFRFKTEAVFEFAEMPKVTRDSTSQPDRFVITMPAGLMRHPLNHYRRDRHYRGSISPHKSPRLRSSA